MNVYSDILCVFTLYSVVALKRSEQNKGKVLSKIEKRQNVSFRFDLGKSVYKSLVE